MANSIKYWREKKGLSRNAMAKRLEMPYQTLEKLEKGITRLSDDWMRRLAPALEVNPAELMVVRDETGAIIDKPSKFVDEPDELAMLRLWGKLLPEDRFYLLKTARGMLRENLSRVKLDDVSHEVRQDPHD